MKRWRLSASPQALSSDLVHTLVSGIGTPHLASNGLKAFAQALPTTFCTVFVVGSTGQVETVSAASSYGSAAENTAALYVERRYDRRDPHMRWLAQRQLPRQTQLWLAHHRGDEIQDTEYRQACYDGVGIRERASVLQLSPAGERAAVSFYRSFTQPPFGEREFAVLAQHATLLGAVVAAQRRSWMPAPEGDAPSLQSRLLALTVREREVISELLQGRTAKEAARVLGIETTTVRTLQYRAFGRLGVRSVRELMRQGSGAAASRSVQAAAAGGR